MGQASSLKVPSPDAGSVFREEIKRLYIEESRTLKEVMPLMKERHSFRATATMYKAYLAKWGLNKEFEEG
jgi:hypothetical protein